MVMKVLQDFYGGQRVSKTHVRVEAYGTMDEVCSLLGVIIAEIREDEKLNDILGRYVKNVKYTAAAF